MHAASSLQAVGVVAREILFSALGHRARAGRERFSGSMGALALPARTAFLLWLGYARLLRDTELCLKTFLYHSSGAFWFL
jgi:hypothetical protein